LILMDNEKPFLVETGKGFNLTYRKRAFYAPVNPEDSVKRKIISLTLQEKTLILIPSPGLGYGLAELVAKLPPFSHILCIEVDKLLWDFCAINGSFPHCQNLTLLQTSDCAVLLQHIHKIGIHHFRRTLLLPLSGGFGLNSSLYNQLFKTVEAEIQNFWQNKITLIHMAPHWIKNIFINLRHWEPAHSIESLKTDKPVFIAGAGPSLEEAIDTIKQIRKHIMLVCVDTAFPVLWQHNIQPDFILIVECQLANLWDFMVCINPGIPVICDLSSNPQVIRKLQTTAYFFCSQFYPLKLFKRLQQKRLLPPMIPALGSVGIAALYIATLLTQAPILFAGLDFSYAKHKTHSSGAPYSDQLLIQGNRLQPAYSRLYSIINKRPLLKTKNRLGAALLTDLVLNSYAGKARELIQQQSNDNNRVFYNLGYTGLDLGGSHYTDLKNIVMPVAQNDSDCIPAANAQAVADFFKDESALLKHAAQAVREALAQKTRGTGLQLLMELDYLYLHFPDTVEPNDCEENVLLRILISIEHYLEIIRKSASTASEERKIF